MFTASPASSLMPAPVARDEGRAAQSAAIRAYVANGGHSDPMVRWELARAAAAAAHDLVARPERATVRPEQAEAVDSDPSLPVMLLGGGACLLLWAFVGWALAPYAAKAIAWLSGGAA